MAPSYVAARSDGLSITSASVKKGRPTVVKYSWKLHADSPTYFAVGIVEVSLHDFTLLKDNVVTRDYSDIGIGEDTVSIEVLKRRPGKYVLVLVAVDDYDKVFATSKAFQVAKSDF